MIRTLRSLVVVSGLLAGACADDNDDPGTGPGGGLDASVDGAVGDAAVNLDATVDGGPRLGFFVTSTTSKTANLGGLAAADTRCQTLAAAAGQGERVWHAFLSVEHDVSRDGGATSAFDRIGAGPWYNSKQALVAADRQDLTLRFGDPALFLDEKGNRINGQWIGSPTPNEHDILTGTLLDGGVAFGKTCGDWVIDSLDGGAVAAVGHSDGLGPNQDSTSPRNSWFAAHDNESCGNTLPRGGAGRIYCFAAD